MNEKQRQITAKSDRLSAYTANFMYKFVFFNLRVSLDWGDTLLTHDFDIVIYRVYTLNGLFESLITSD